MEVGGLLLDQSVTRIRRDKVEVAITQMPAEVIECPHLIIQEPRE